MDYSKVIGELRLELQQINAAIIALERELRGSGKRRGRPPKWMAEAAKSAPPKPKRKRAAN
jgi:hypothetical protein